MPAPQWRKYVADLLATDTEIIDIYPVFQQWVAQYGNDRMLFSKEHHLSPLGTHVVAKAIADYLKHTTEGLQPNLRVQQRRCHIYDKKARQHTRSECFFNYVDSGNDSEVLWHQREDSCDFAVFGDCNLQSYSEYGAGIIGNLSYELQHSIHDAGRMLLFDGNREPDNRISRQAVDDLLKYNIVIYIAFGSASFVRSSTVPLNSEVSKFRALRWHLRPKDNFSWSNFNF